MVCKNCGAEIFEGDYICRSCKTLVDEGGTAGNIDMGEPDKSGNKKRSKAYMIISHILSAILAVVFFAIGLVWTSSFLVRNMVTKEAVSAVLEDVNIGEIVLPAENGEEKKLSEIIFENIDQEAAKEAGVDQELIDKILCDEEVNTYLKDTVGDIAAVLNGEQEITFDPNDVVDLVKKKTPELTGEEMDPGVLDDIKSYLSDASFNINEAIKEYVDPDTIVILDVTDEAKETEEAGETNEAAETDESAIEAETSEIKETENVEETEKASDTPVINIIDSDKGDSQSNLSVFEGNLSVNSVYKLLTSSLIMSLAYVLAFVIVLIVAVNFKNIKNAAMTVCIPSAIIAILLIALKSVTGEGLEHASSQIGISMDAFAVYIGERINKYATIWIAVAALMLITYIVLRIIEARKNKKALA